MSRFLCFTLFILTALPLFAQDEPILPEQRPLPRSNQAVLQRMRQQLTQELQNVQRMISAINPNETQFIDLLHAQQKELSMQLQDISQQLAGFNAPSTAADEAPEETPAALPEMPTPAKPLPPAMPSPAMPNVRPAMPNVRTPDTGMPMGMPQTMPGMRSNPYSEIPPYPASGMGMGNMGTGMPGMAGGMPAWTADQATDAANPWAPKPSKELLEMKQTVDSMRGEIAELKETIKALETQIRLLNRNIELSGRAQE